MGLISWWKENILEPVVGWVATDSQERAATTATAAAMAAILKRQYDDGLISAGEYQARAAEIGATADLKKTVGNAVVDDIPRALSESVSELPDRISTALDTAGKTVWRSVPGWLLWLGGAVALIGGVVAVFIYLPGTRRLANATASRAASTIAPKPTRKRTRKK